MPGRIIRGLSVVATLIFAIAHAQAESNAASSLPQYDQYNGVASDSTLSAVGAASGGENAPFKEWVVQLGSDGACVFDGVTGGRFNAVASGSGQSFAAVGAAGGQRYDVDSWIVKFDITNMEAPEGQERLASSGRLPLTIASGQQTASIDTPPVEQDAADSIDKQNAKHGLGKSE